MATLNIDGRTITIDDSFLKLSPEEQNSTIEEIHKSLPPTYDAPGFNKYIADKYGARPEDVEGLKRSIGSGEALKGIPIAGAYVDKLGGYLSAASSMAGIPGGASGESFSERAAKNTAMQTEIAKAYEAAHPVAATAANIIGGTTALGGLGTTAAGARVLGIVGGGLGRQALAGAASGGTIGALDAAARGGNPAEAGLAGAALGGGLPIAGQLAGYAIGPIASNILARINPERYAQSQVARAIIESGQTSQDIANSLREAAAEGQPQFNVADALGLSGQRMLSGVARQPGEARQMVADALEARQAGQGRRIASQLAEGFQAPQTAAQTETRMTAARDAAANAQYGAARQNAVPVDLSRTIANIDATLQPGATQLARPQSGLANDSIERALEGVRSRLTDGRSMLSDFTAVQRVRGDLADMVQQARQSGQGNRARLLGGVLRQMDADMENASQGFLQANRNYAQASRNIDAITEGRTAALRGRTENTIPAFQGLTPEGQAAFRAGYVDPLIEQAQSAAYGVNKARPLTSDAFRAEAGAMAPNAGRLARQLGREQTMFETRNQALGGSMTAQNLADNAALGFDPALVSHVAQGNWMGALRSAMGSVSNGLTGNTPAVRQAVANLLLSHGMTAAHVNRILDETVRRILMVQNAARLAGRSLAGGTALQANQR